MAAMRPILVLVVIGAVAVTAPDAEAQPASASGEVEYSVLRIRPSDDDIAVPAVVRAERNGTALNRPQGTRLKGAERGGAGGNERHPWEATMRGLVSRPRIVGHRREDLREVVGCRLVRYTRW
jgi:hypothetical protein